VSKHEVLEQVDIKRLVAYVLVAQHQHQQALLLRRVHFLLEEAFAEADGGVEDPALNRWWKLLLAVLSEVEGFEVAVERLLELSAVFLVSESIHKVLLEAGQLGYLFEDV